MRLILISLVCLFGILPIRGIAQQSYIEAPYSCTIKRQFYKRRYGDITTNGRVWVAQVEFQNLDTLPRAIDYHCFYLADAEGYIFEVHLEATAVRQLYYEDFHIKDVDVIGLNHQTVKPRFRTKGILGFEVPEKGNYHLKFRGYVNQEGLFRKGTHGTDRPNR